MQYTIHKAKCNMQTIKCKNLQNTIFAAPDVAGRRKNRRKTKCTIQKTKCEMQNAECNKQNGKGKGRNKIHKAKCNIQTAKCNN